MPADSLQRTWGGATRPELWQSYADCFEVPVASARPIALADFIEAFYTSWPFRLERWIIALAVSRPSTDEQARELARGERTQFAAWTVSARNEHEILLTDLRGQTRSWLAIEPLAAAAEAAARTDVAPRADVRHHRTLLRFGSGIARDPKAARGTAGNRALPAAFRLILRFHLVYSRVLLSSAVRRLRRLRE